MGAVWLTSLAWWNAARPASGPIAPTGNDAAEAAEHRAVVHGLLLDAAPTPLIAIENDTVRVLNRAARNMFGADDRIIPPPPALFDSAAGHLTHEGRRWRIDRIVASGTFPFAVAALIDFEREEHVAEARASAELIEVLGHELLNGLAPIISLAESVAVAVERTPVDQVLIGEIIGPLARRAEGLQRFATGYRALARLPDPDISPVELEGFARDLKRSFEERWPAIALDLTAFGDGAWPMDRDQIDQAVWALMSNAVDAAVGVPQPQVMLAIAREKGKLVITVADNGPGVPASAAAHIFRPFHTTKTGGSGVGLSLARQIARSHGGSLTLTAAAPTQFRLSLPG